MNLRDYFLLIIVMLPFYSAINAQGSSCANAEPFCAGDDTLIFPNSNRNIPGARPFAEPGINYSCATGNGPANGGGWPYPVWYYLRIDQDGDLIFTISQTVNFDGTGGTLDVDFVAWGPFNDPNVNCTGDLTPANKVDCSWSGAATETMTINGALEGEIYLVMISNYSEDPGFISMEQTNASAVSGSTDCSIVTTDTYCEGDLVDLDGTTTGAFTYEWLKDGVMLPETGPILQDVGAPNASYACLAIDNLGSIIATYTFTLIFESQPIANPVSNVVLCDDDKDGVVEFDLDTKTPDIIGIQDTTQFTVSYHATQADADIGDNPLPFNYDTTTTAVTTFYARIENNNREACYDTTSFTVQGFFVTANTIPDALICDDNNDGFWDINLSDYDATILGTQDATKYHISYHLSPADASNANAPLSTLYTNSSNPQTIHVRIENIDNVACYDTTSFIIEVFDSPVANIVPDQFICDDNNDGVWSFDFNLLDNTVLGGQLAADYAISYHKELVGAENGTDALVFPYTNTNEFEIIYVRIENKNNISCFSTTRFDLKVFNTPVANMPIYELCDDTDDGDDTNGVGVTFDLSTKITDVLGTQNLIDYNVTFYNTQAEANIGAVGTDLSVVVNTQNNQEVVARIENNLFNDCFDTVSFELVVNPLPVITSVVELKQCDDDIDGISIFNLTEANSLISVDSANELFTFYATEAMAELGLVTDQIINDTAYVNPTPLNSTVFVRIETLNGCYRTAKINLVVGATQIPASFNLNYEVCDDTLVDGDNKNGIATFNFSDATAQIEAIFPVGQNIFISYYTNLTDALSEVNEIIDISNHRNETSPNSQDIYVRVDSEDVNACLGLGIHVTLNVIALPDVNSIANYVLCSDTDTADFQLETIDSDVIGSQTMPLLVSYHLSLQDAIDNNNPFDKLSYLNISNPETIYVRSQFDTNGNGLGDLDECVNTEMSFDLVVNRNPILFEPDGIRICSNQVDTLYDLTTREAQITGGDNTITLSYYESLVDLNNNNPIPDPSAYTSTILDKEIIVQGTGTNLCTTVTTLQLTTILYALINKNPSTIEVCEIDNDGFDVFDITRRETEILNGLNVADFTFTYYEDELDAIAGNANSIANLFNFENTVIIRQTIYVRVLPVANECFIVVPITLVVNPVPEIEIFDNYVICLNNLDAVIFPENATLVPYPPIDTKLDNIDYTFQWYAGAEADVVADPNSVIIAGATLATYMPDSEGMYTVVATNKLTGCTILATTEVEKSYPPESIGVEVTSELFSGNNVLEVTVVGNGSYEFNIDNGPWQSSPILENVSGGKHTVYVRDLFNCNELNAVKFVIDYPKFFTPNDDGYNDTWNIKGIYSQPDATIFIFDRFGKLLKQLKPDGNGWDGTFNGRKLPSGDYWFTLEYVEPLDDINRIFKSHFTLKR